MSKSGTRGFTAESGETMKTWAFRVELQKAKEGLIYEKEPV